mmetsp:Transcript_20233/g.38721  ORF Transcript_20233/g.38721 Transcript_20233/m.38721 type:complete len:243 (+) Transcript_20233:363-1091(+)
MSSTRRRMVMPALITSGWSFRTNPRRRAYWEQIDSGDHGNAPPCSTSRVRGSAGCILTISVSRFTTGLMLSTEGRGLCPAFSASQRTAVKGSLTCARGTRPATICASRGTSRRGNTTPGLSHRHVVSSRMYVCRILVWPGVFFTATALCPTSELSTEDLPTFGWPTRPSMRRAPFALAASMACISWISISTSRARVASAASLPSPPSSPGSSWSTSPRSSSSASPLAPAPLEAAERWARAAR